MSSTSLLVVVPLYKQPDLLPALFQSLIDVADEISQLNASVLLINDSPNFAPLADALIEELPALQAAIPVSLFINAENLGFVRSCNFAMAQARDNGADVLLLNSDALLTPGALRELAEVALLDPMISVVSPRSNNATICNSPYPEAYRSLDPAAAHRAHLAIERYLPRYSYVPTAVGFCLYIRHLMLAEFGVFDLAYGGGYNEENDFILRCNQCGYRAVLANRAFVFHLGSVSFAASSVSTESREAKNAVILREKYPEYPIAIARYFESVEFKAQVLLSGLIPNSNMKSKLLFDCRNIGPYHNGTFEHAKRLMQAFVRRYSNRFDCYIACNHDALIFHEFDKITWLRFCWNNEQEMKPFAVVIRCGQPFDHDTLVDIGYLAPVSGYVMLDTIAMDCLHLDDRDLHSLWLDFADTAALIAYNSRFTADQFTRRFNVPDDVVQLVSRCSTDVRDYVDPNFERPLKGDDLAGENGYILIVGNHYPHKNINAVIALLREVRVRPQVIVLGVDIPEADGIVGYRSGELDQSFVDHLYENASLLLFPTHYEGFGLPIIHALAHRTPVVARDVPLFREIQTATLHGRNIHLCKTTAEMVAAAVGGLAWIENPKNIPAQGWSQAADALADGIEEALSRVNFVQLCRRLRRLENRRLLSNAHRQLVRSTNRLSLSPAATGPGSVTDPLADLHTIAKRLPRQKLLMARLMQPWRAPKLRVTPDMPVQSGQSTFQICMSIDSGQAFSTIAESVLDWSQRLLMKGVFETTLAEDLSAEDTCKLLDWARIALLTAGLYPISTRRIGEASVITAIKLMEWIDWLPDDETDEGFVAKLYLGILAREQDKNGARHYLEALAKRQLTRPEILKRLLVCTERYDLLARHYLAAPRVSPLITGALVLSPEDAELRFHWLREVSVLLSHLPGWWSLMPPRWRLRQKHRRLRSRKLFDADVYLARYPDVVKSNMDPLDHYIRHGIGEGRIIA